jgi:negative regulator of sigma E activity
MNRRDIEQLSAYLDGELKHLDLTKLETRLKTDSELVSVLNDICAARTLLRKLPQRKAPRNFTLTRKMVGQNPPLPRTYPIFRFATALATLLFFFSFGINSFGRQMASQNVVYGIGGSGGGGESESLAAEAPLAPEAYADEVATEEPSADMAPDNSDESRLVETPSEKTAEAGNAVEAEQVQAQQETPRIIPATWQVVLAAIALLSALLMGLMRQLSVRRWK